MRLFWVRAAAGPHEEVPWARFWKSFPSTLHGADTNHLMRQTVTVIDNRQDTPPPARFVTTLPHPPLLAVSELSMGHLLIKVFRDCCMCRCWLSLSSGRLAASKPSMGHLLIKVFHDCYLYDCQSILQNLRNTSRSVLPLVIHTE